MFHKITLAVVILCCFISCDYRPQKSDGAPTAAEAKDTLAKAKRPHFDEFGQLSDSLYVSENTVKRNESLYSILDNYGFDPGQIYQTTRRARNVMDVRSFKPGQKYKTYESKDSMGMSLQKMVWQPNPLKYVVFDWSDSLAIYEANKILTTKKAEVSGSIDNSLYQTVSEDGDSPLIAYKLSEIFAWQINFFGLRKGDSFKVVYQKKYVGQQYFGVGKIIGAEFMHQGETYKAFHFTEDGISGYYDENGNSVKKALLKAPFKYNQRISSRFSRHRYHPILHKYMPHYGIDYAAPYGTPVLAVGDGTVTEARYRGANGNLVKITHNSTYRTAYLHLKGFARGIHRGAHVKQGQVIGYVGHTGRATGTHLDYRIYKNNRPQNPLTIDLPTEKSLPDSLLPDFNKIRTSISEQFITLKENKADSTAGSQSVRL